MDKIDFHAALKRRVHAQAEAEILNKYPSFKQVNIIADVTAGIEGAPAKLEAFIAHRNAVIAVLDAKLSAIAQLTDEEAASGEFDIYEGWE